MHKTLIQTYISGKPRKSSYLVTLATLLLMAGMSQVYWHNLFGWAQLMPAVQSKVFEDREWWRLLTAVFIHSDLGHFFSNAYMLVAFSFFVYGHFGFGIYPILSIFFAGLVNALTILSYPPDVQLLGASGLVYILGGFWLTSYVMIQRQFPFVRRLVRTMGIAIMIFFPSSFVPSTSYRAHAYGFLAGMFLAVIYFVSNKERIRSAETYKIEAVEISSLDDSPS